jgi:hypothetical protein
MNKDNFAALIFTHLLPHVDRYGEGDGRREGWG